MIKEEKCGLIIMLLALAFQTNPLFNFPEFVYVAIWTVFLLGAILFIQGE